MKLYRNIKDNHIYRIREVNATKHTSKWYVAMPHYEGMGTCETYDDLNDFIFMIDTEIKSCKNCKFYKSSDIDYEFAVCTHSAFDAHCNPVSGERTSFCNILRKYSVDCGGCGKEARYYEKRVSWWEKLWNR